MTERVNDINDIDVSGDEQSIMAIALSLATELNECCDSIEDVKTVLSRLDEILKLRF